MKKLILLTLVPLFGLFLAACGLAPTQNSPAVNDEAKMMIVEPWARASTIEGGTSAIYLTVVNHTGSDDVLLRATSAVAEAVELHESVMDDASRGVMKMSPLTNLVIPAGEAIALEPGGKHVMLIGLKQPLQVGDTIQATLVFEKAGQVTVEAKVSGDSGNAAMDQEHQMEPGQPEDSQE
jgi:hypothetical protein